MKKRILALVMSVIMLVSMSVHVFAMTGTFNVTIDCLNEQRTFWADMNASAISISSCTDWHSSHAVDYPTELYTDAYVFYEIEGEETYIWDSDTQTTRKAYIWYEYELPTGVFPTRFVAFHNATLYVQGKYYNEEYIQEIIEP